MIKVQRVGPGVKFFRKVWGGSPALGFEPRRDGYVPADLESAAISQTLPRRLGLVFRRSCVIVKSCVFSAVNCIRFSDVIGFYDGVQLCSF